MKKFLIIVSILLGLAVLGGLGGALGVYYWAASDLPDFKELRDYKPALVTTVLARDGRVMGTFSREMRYLRHLDEMPEYLPRAFLAAEDAGFYQHEGVDIAAILRAAVANFKAGEIKQGASTITQQVIKRMLLTDERSYERKLKEAILAYRLEKYLSKDEILFIYLNDIYFGAGAYGVEAAARVYFGCHVQDLTLAQAAMLGGLPQAPSRYNPYRHFDLAKARQRYVLDRMEELAWITPEEHDQALAEQLEVKAMPDPSWGVGAWYLEEVRRWAVDRFGEDAVYTSGMEIHTACDLDHQAAAEAALIRGLDDSAHRRGWDGPLQHLESEQVDAFLAAQEIDPAALQPGARVKVVVQQVDAKGADVRFGAEQGYVPVATMHWAREFDPAKATEEVASIKDARTVVAPGDVVLAAVEKLPAPDAAKPVWELALEREPDVQGALVSMELQTGQVLALVGGYDFAQSQFNRATQAKRQPGSSFKPIVYSAALDNGFTPASVVLDAPIVYDDTTNDRLWKPENFEGRFYGPTLLRTALAKSRNLCTIRVAQKIGIPTIIERAKALGLEGEFPDNLSVALGSAEVTLLNLCQAYSAFGRGGTSVEPVLVTEVFDAWREPIFTADPEIREAISPQTAYIMTQLMEEVVRDGTGWRAKELGRPVAGKTGTSNDERDAWFMGFTPQLLTGVFVGFDDNRVMGKYETGGRAASPIWVDYRKQVEANYPVEDFPRPPDVTMVRVDSENGLLAGVNTKDSFFLPFKKGTEPTRVSEGESGMAQKKTAQDDLFKQIF